LTPFKTPSHDGQFALPHIVEVQPAFSPDITYSYYDFIEPYALSHLQAQDVQDLERRQCFRLPTRPLLDEIMMTYFMHVQPHFPLIDEAIFWQTYPSGNPEALPMRRRWSLFTIQAMLCVASSVSSH
jgi:hypothetical protein